MSWAGRKTRLTLVTMLAAVPLGAVAGREPSAAAIPPSRDTCAQGAPDTQAGSARCVVWLAAETHSPATSFDRLSAPATAQPDEAAAVSSTSVTNHVTPASSRVVSTLGMQPTAGLSFKGIPLGLWFTGLVVLAYALRRCERVWPQSGGAPATGKTAYLSTEAGRL
jgi:hypothetical protein